MDMPSIFRIADLRVGGTKIKLRAPEEGGLGPLAVFKPTLPPGWTQPHTTFMACEQSMFSTPPAPASIASCLRAAHIPWDCKPHPGRDGVPL